MEFRLLYSGALPPQSRGGGGHIDTKHHIRKQIHRQLRELWQHHPYLTSYFGVLPGVTRKLIVPTARDDEPTTRLDFIARNFTKYGFRFIPLISNEFGTGCSVDILFLRRDDPGNLIVESVDGGDIDNRIKTLWDALQVPHYNQDLGFGKFKPEEGEDPFFVLLENDNLITEVKVTTDRLLTPVEQGEGIKDVHIVMHVKTKIVDYQKAPSIFAH